ncbi:MAG: SIS domain-containing protein [Deltaproteobacteria bacterium]|nr:SIS domain-containing protein [Deltaproteobacteria bacterium]
MNSTDIAPAALIEAANSLTQLLEQVVNGCGSNLQAAVASCCEALRCDKKILFFGNGGSATQAQHLAAELINRFLLERKPLAAMALTPDAAVITSIGNDYAFNEIFSRQIIGLGQPGDIAIALSTSGTSENIVAGLKQARQLGLTTIGLLGRDGGRCLNFCDITLLVPATDTARIQEVHLLLGHLLCGLVEKELATVI